jgi:glycosyltransferase involved in cell wall biosynthesis
MTKGLRIALVSAFPPGKCTLNEYGFHLARAFAAHPDVAEVIVLADILPEPQPELDLGPATRVKRVWNFNGMGTPLRILRALFAERPDAVIYNTQTASFGDRELTAALGLLTPAISRFAGWKSGVIAHNIIAGIDLETTLLKGQRLRQTLVRLGGAAVTRAMTWASYMTVTLRGYAETLEARVPYADVTLVPHGTFEIGNRPLIPQGERPMRIVTMGKFGTYKRLETLLAAFDRLRAMPDTPKLELVIGGSDHPNTPGYVQGLADARANDDGVKFAGYVAEEDVPGFFEGARLAVFDYEATTGSSGVLHQAASLGTVPVFPRIGDFVDLARDEGLCGGNFEPRDVDGLAGVMRDLLADPYAADRIAATNRRAVAAVPMSDIAAWHIAKILDAPDMMPAFD